jgi:hypothetical protein
LETLTRPTTTDTSASATRLTAFIEHRPAADLTVRLEGGNLTAPAVRLQTRVYGGPRSTAALLYVDDRRLADGQYVLLRVRKTLN